MTSPAESGTPSKKSQFTPKSPKDLRAKGRWFGLRGMEKTANDFFNAADILEEALRQLAEKQAEVEAANETMYGLQRLLDGYFNARIAEHNAKVDAALAARQEEGK